MRPYHRTTIATARVNSPSDCLAQRAWLVLASLCIACPSAAAAYDFTLGAYGPNRVVQGHDLYIEETSIIADTAGTDVTGRAFAFYFVDGLPAGATASWPSIEASCCGGNRNWKPKDTLLKIKLPSKVPTGPYTITLRVESGGVTRQIPYKMAVDPVPRPLPKTVVSSIPPIPDLSTWEDQMRAYGKPLCNPATIAKQGSWEGGVWYYDGIRVFHQIADYTGDSSWKTCADYVKAFYKPYVNSTHTPGWRVFPHGLYQDYLRTQDASSKAAAIRLSTASAYAALGGGVGFGVNGLQRETAYLIHAYRIAGYLGKPNPELYARSVDFVLGMIDQMFVSRTDPYLKPFMTGLMMEALIQYYGDSRDPRVPPAIKAAADGLWTRAWMPDSHAFYYQSSDNPLKASPDLNLLIAPAYAWLYKITGNPVYRQEGDLIFQGGVNGAYLSDGKHFSQNYRWSFDYVKWRLHPDAT